MCIRDRGNENEEVAIYRYVTKGTFDAYNWSLVENKQRFISQVMTSKAVSRSCEDIDEATLSYAEIKAVATGNPLIREKMEIDNDVQRLKLLKASYDNQRYGLQDNFMIKYPKLIKTATEKLANVREDIKARDKELIDNPEFAITDVYKRQFVWCVRLQRKRINAKNRQSTMNLQSSWIRMS